MMHWCHYNHSSLITPQREMSLCLCWLCLNTWLIFDAVMAEENKSSWSIFTSITQFFTNDCQCPVSSNGFLSWSRVNGKCEECKSSVHNFITADANFVLYSQFEQTENPYLKKSCSETTEKRSKKKRKEIQESTMHQHLRK